MTIFLMNLIMNRLVGMGGLGTRIWVIIEVLGGGDGSQGGVESGNEGLGGGGVSMEKGTIMKV